VCLTPYYDAAICAALVDVGCTVRCVTSRFLYDPAFANPDTFDHLYFRGLNHPCLLNYPRLRRVLRLFHYSFGHQQLLRQVQAARPDVVHIQWSRLPLLDRWLVTGIRSLAIPIVHTVHDVTPLFDHVGAGGMAQLYMEVDHLIVHTKMNRDALLEYYPHLDPAQVTVLPHIALNSLFPCNGDRASARHILGIPSDVPVILFFGSIRPYKGVEILVDAYLRARQICSDVWLIVAGQPEKPYMASISSQLNNQSIVELSYIPSDRVWIYHCAADLAVFPYREISQSGALITAMGFGLPVIVTEVGGLPETVDGNGWVVPPGDSVTLGEVLAEAVSDRERLIRMGRRSQQLLQDRHSAALTAQLTIDVYEEALRCSAFFTAPTV
jgi:glycosyltransferase involved in cell wall biosynthesis